MASSSILLNKSKLWPGPFGSRLARPSPTSSRTTSSFLSIQSRKASVGFSPSHFDKAVSYRHRYDQIQQRDWLSSFHFQQIYTKAACRAFTTKSNDSLSNDGSRHPPRKSNKEKGPSKYSPPVGQKPPRLRHGQNDNIVMSVSDTLDDYMQRRDKFKPYEVAATWSKLGKALAQSPHHSWERQNCWIQYQANVRMLLDQTIPFVDQLDGRSTATVTHSLVKLLHLTNAKSLGDHELQPLWNALVSRTAHHLQSEDGGFNARDISSLVWAYAKSNDVIKVDDRLLSAIVTKAERCVDDFAPQELSMVVWACATLNHKAPSLFEAIAHVAQGRIADFKPQGLSNTAWAFATLNHKALPLFDAIAQASQQQIDHFTPQHLSNTSWSFARLDHKVPSLFDAIACAAQARIGNFNPQNLSNTVWAFARLNHKAPSLFDAIASVAPARIDDFIPQHLSKTAWAFATLNHEAPSLFEAIACAAQARINDFNPRELSNISWSFARLDHKAPSLFEAIARASQRQIDHFNPQGLSNTSWAFAILNHKAPSLFEAIAQASQQRIGNFNPQELSNTSWSFARLNHKAPSLFDAIARVAQGRITDFKPQGLSNTAWAFATLNHKALPLFDAIAQASQQQIDHFTPQHLSNTSWSFARLDHNVPSLFDAIAHAAQKRIADFGPQNLSNTAWAFATLNYEAVPLFEAIAKQALLCIGDFNPQGLSNTAWSFAVFNVAPDLFIPANSPFAQTLMSTDPSTFIVENLTQLHQFHMWCKEQNAEIWLPKEMRQACHAAFLSGEAEPSRFQNDVVESLRGLQDVSHVEVEVSTESGYRLNAVVSFRGDRIGVEVDGPYHFLGQSQNPNGSTVLKRRQLRALEGWKLVSVPYWEWNELDTGSNNERKERKQMYLQNLLDRAVVAQ